MSGEAEIFEASASDAEEISAFSIKTYVDTFGAEFEPDELAHHQQKTVSVAAWRAYLARDRVLLAREGGRLVGFAQFGPAERAGEIEIRRLYVYAPDQGRGIGSAPLRQALAAPEVIAADAVSIDVWEHNAGARRLYERFGFRHEGGFEPFYLSSGEIDGRDLILIRHRGEDAAV